MRLTYDRESDAAYLMVVETIAPGEAAYQVRVPENENIAGQIILDLDGDGKLLGLEVLSASDALSPAVLEAAELL